ncbi:MAG: serine/threonine-protein kinase HipA [Verrucomicrobiales bacterium]|jgi:serine/threonine-protein kinase HipA
MTLEPIPAGTMFSREGLRRLDPKLLDLRPLDLSHEEQLEQARQRADKMSVQGFQPKLSAVLKVKQGRFEVVDRGGTFLLKPNPPGYEEVPANEALTMTMAAAAGIEVPVHGLVPAVDGSWVYFIRRFDRAGRSAKRHVEDFAQLLGGTRETKYDSSIERVISVIENYCTFPALEKPKLARRLLFCFLTGNEDMHLKNFSLQVKDDTISLTPAYDLLNSTLAMGEAVEESALPLKGKKKNLTRKLWVDYLCKERLKLSSPNIEDMLNDLATAAPVWQNLIERSCLTLPGREAYQSLLSERLSRLSLVVS